MIENLIEFKLNIYETAIRDNSLDRVFIYAALRRRRLDLSCRMNLILAK